ncbi:cupin domain-containing protein [Qipengyuania atrilutea]|uniref:Cupin domain-containing protein n=1 Tax=Qipengyuania atrilutea TaxID=2744473 RepID=A0A850H6E2_9SPHN|nr:cupin domain-containing protein [Actirhodobacter atriluteus]NVD45383.1 cupin domain-containing protein [Actirhodobacter atriluteus]
MLQYPRWTPFSGALAVLLTGCAGGAAPQASAPATTPASFALATGTEVRAQVAEMLAEMKPDQGFMWRPLVEAGPYAAAIEIWKKPGRPATHPTEAEYAIVLEGAGTLIAGDTMVAPVTLPGGMIEGDRIHGNTQRPLRPGDVILIPAGVPHWFGVTGDRLVLLGTKIPEQQ